MSAEVVTLSANERIVPNLELPGETLSDLNQFVERLQSALAGSPILDAEIDAVLIGTVSGALLPAHPTERWSEDLTALLRLIPPDHDFSLGQRNGVLWAWIQPSDEWTPSTYEMRHDHPKGSGLLVAHTLPLATAAALVKLRVLGRQTELAL